MCLQLNLEQFEGVFGEAGDEAGRESGHVDMLEGGLCLAVLVELAECEAVDAEHDGVDGSVADKRQTQAAEKAYLLLEGRWEFKR